MDDGSEGVLGRDMLVPKGSDLARSRLPPVEGIRSDRKGC